jgi:AraC-like DNA-binding protein
MTFVFDHKSSASIMVEAIWRTRHEGGGSFISAADSHMEMVVTRQEHKTSITVRGAETQARPAPIPEDADFFGIIFKLGTFVQPLPTSKLINGGLELPNASSNKFWLNGSAWEFPTFDNADVFLERLVREELLVKEPLVEAALQGDLKDYSLRSVQRRFLQATGLTQKAIQQIDRAKKAMALLQQGKSILDTAYEMGYFDQSHLTNSLKHFIGQTPAQILKQSEPE